MGLGVTLAPECYLRLIGRQTAPQAGPWHAFGDIRPDDFPHHQAPKQE